MQKRTNFEKECQQTLPILPEWQAAQCFDKARETDSQKRTASNQSFILAKTVTN